MRELKALRGEMTSSAQGDLYTYAMNQHAVLSVQGGQGVADAVAGSPPCASPIREHSIKFRVCGYLRLQSYPGLCFRGNKQSVSTEYRAGNLNT